MFKNFLQMNLKQVKAFLMMPLKNLAQLALIRKKLLIPKSKPSAPPIEICEMFNEK